MSNQCSVSLLRSVILCFCLVAICSCGDDGTDSETVITEIVEPAYYENGRIYQRDSDGQYDMWIQGYCKNSDAEAVEARVVQDNSQDEIVPWTIIDDDASDGTFSGFLEDIPQGGWYNIQVRVASRPESIVSGRAKFGVGALIVCAGQSHIDLWFETFLLFPEIWEEYGEVPPNRLTRMYRHEQVLQQGPPWTGWQSVTGVGAAIFANKLQEALQVPIGLLDYAVGGSSLWQRNAIDNDALGLTGFPDVGWWLSDNSNVAPGLDNYQTLKEGLDTIGNKVEAVLWVQGHTDAAAGEPTAGYQSGLEELFSKMRSDSDVPDLPIFISLVTRQGPQKVIIGGVEHTYPPISDEYIQNVRTAEEKYCEIDSTTYVGCTTIDLPLSPDNVHHSPEGQEIQAKRLAQAVLHVLKDSGGYTYHRGPQLAGYDIVDSSFIDVHIAHDGGDNFTPESDIKGFEILFGDSAVVPISVNRIDNDTIRLETDDTGGVAGIRYLYGGNPGNLDLQSFAHEYIHDNSGMHLPLEGGVLAATP